MNKGKKKQKTKEEEITEVLIDLEKDLSNLKLNIVKKDKTEYIRIYSFKRICSFIDISEKGISKII